MVYVNRANLGPSDNKWLNFHCYKDIKGMQILQTVENSNLCTTSKEARATKRSGNVLLRNNKDGEEVELFNNILAIMGNLFSLDWFIFCLVKYCFVKLLFHLSSCFKCIELGTLVVEANHWNVLPFYRNLKLVCQNILVIKTFSEKMKGNKKFNLALRVKHREISIVVSINLLWC